MCCRGIGAGSFPTVGDAAMAPYELMDSGGSIDMFYINKEPGIYWLRRIAEKFKRSVWLNPVISWSPPALN